jgi:orotidine-5'-phosphate decarboxylase
MEELYMIDTLIAKIMDTGSPVCVGMDTKLDYVPKDFLRGDNSDLLAFATRNVFEFNRAIIDKIADIVPCVKVQSAYYELYGYRGVEVFYKTIQYAKEKGLVVIADVKRNDIGSTAAAYSSAYLGRVRIKGEEVAPFDADFVTVNAYLGTDGVKPFLNDCSQYKKGIFILVKTSNPSSGELQDMDAGGEKVFEHMADMVEAWGSGMIGKYGYSSVGAVVGATYPGQAKSLREKHKSIFMLIPGYGAQGATAHDILPNFDEKGLGGIVNSSRAILTAYQKEAYQHLNFADAARAAALDMKKDIMNALQSVCK